MLRSALILIHFLIHKFSFFSLVVTPMDGLMVLMLLVLVPAFKGCLSQVVFLARFTKRQPS